MKNAWKDGALALLFGMILPYLVTGLVLMGYEEEAEPTHPRTEPQTEQIVFQSGDDTRSKMELDEYLVGVLLREMPEDFEFEAKKAQAVVARTYARRACRSDKHDGAVCGDSACCQGYYDIDQYISDGGSEEAVLLATQAVAETAGQVLTYEGELIDATYFSCSGGQTEDARAVWGADIPYLQSVESPGEESAAHFTDTVTFTAGEFADALGAELKGSPAAWLEDVTYTAGGGVDTMTICGQRYSGTQLRSLLSLRSTAITMTAVGENIIITTRGFGHRVGMSQYGADAMAVRGSTYGEILAHYYQGAVLESIAN